MTVGRTTMQVTPVPGIPFIAPGDDLAAMIIDAIERAGLEVADGDIFVVAQKIVSKSENRYVNLASVTPSEKARQLAEEADKDPRVVELMLRESSEVVRCAPGVIVVAHRLGCVLANAGIDASNLDADASAGERVLLLPENPDATSERLRKAFESRFRRRVGVIISDSIGRAWRLGTVGTALGVSGPPALIDQIGGRDLFGRELKATVAAFADQVAAAAALVMGEAAEGLPVARVSGLAWESGASSGRALLRPREKDLFR